MSGEDMSPVPGSEQGTGAVDSADGSKGKAASPSGAKNGAKRRKKRTKQITEIVAVVVLSVTAVLTAWCGFESSKWGGAMSISFSQASSARIASSTASGQASDNRSFDLVIYAQYVEAVAHGDTNLADYIEARFTPQFAVAFADWNAEGRTLKSPLAEPSYVPDGTEQAAAAAKKADGKFDEALDFNQRGDNYSILTVLFALVLFFTALSGRDVKVWASRVFLGCAIVLAIVGIAVLSTYPVLI